MAWLSLIGPTSRNRQKSSTSKSPKRTRWIATPKLKDPDRVPDASKVRRWCRRASTVLGLRFHSFGRLSPTLRIRVGLSNSCLDRNRRSVCSIS
jgi:hypothetical protein